MAKIIIEFDFENDKKRLELRKKISSYIIDLKIQSQYWQKGIKNVKIRSQK